MRNRILIVAVVVLLALACLGFAPKVVAVRNDYVANTTASTSNEPYSFFLDDAEGRLMKIDIWPDDPEFLEWFEEGDKILENYLGDDYVKYDVVPMTVGEIYSGDARIPKGMSYNGKVWVNIDDSMYDGDIRPMVVTYVHEQLHMNGTFKFSFLSEEDNVKLAEYVVYRLSEKACLAYDEEKYSGLDYGDAPWLDLDEHLDELCQVFLGNQKADKELKAAVEAAFQ